MVGLKEKIQVIRRKLFLNSTSPISASTLDKVARNEKDECILCEVALHLNTSVETLEYLTELKNKHVWWGVANNPNTKKSRLDILADCDDYSIQMAVYANPNTRKETREKIWKRNNGNIFIAKTWYQVRGIKVVASGN